MNDSWHHCLSPPLAIGHLQDAVRGQSVRDDFEAGNASENMQDSLYDPGVEGDCQSHAGTTLSHIVLFFFSALHFAVLASLRVLLLVSP